MKNYPLHKFTGGALTLLVIVVMFGCRKEQEPPKTTIVLFLVDATNSLFDAENNKVAALATEILDRLPGKTQFAMYPIQIEADRVRPIIPDGVVSIPENDVEERDNDKIKSERAQTIEKKLRSLYDSGKRLAEDRRTCIMNMLWFAEDLLKQKTQGGKLDGSKFKYRVVIISDMVEECGNTSLGEVRLNKTDISHEINLADDFSQVTSRPDFSAVKITIIFPLTDQSPSTLSRRPADRDLRDFWKKIFIHCNMQAAWFWDSDHIEWISTGQLPGWLPNTAKR